MNRRRLLAATGTATLAAVAGCTGSLGTDDGGSQGNDGGNDESGSGGDGTPVAEHPAAAGLGELPRQGDLAGHVILAFEDPSCPRCAAFERETVPKIRENIVGEGNGAYVLRTYPVVYEWGKPASQALASTFARSEDAFWALADHYFSEQDGFGTDNVLDRTVTFLDRETDLDGAAVATDAHEKAHDAAVQANLDAGEAADVGRTTPTVLLFRDGTYTTRASGSVSYRVIANALGEA